MTETIRTRNRPQGQQQAKRASLFFGGYRVPSYPSDGKDGGGAHPRRRLSRLLRDDPFPSMVRLQDCHRRQGRSLAEDVDLGALIDPIYGAVDPFSSHQRSLREGTGEPVVLNGFAFAGLHQDRASLVSPNPFIMTTNTIMNEEKGSKQELAHEKRPGRPVGVSPKRYPMTPLKRSVSVFMALNGLTRKEAAAHLGISYGVLSRIFTNVRPSTRVLAQLASGGVIINDGVLRSLE